MITSDFVMASSYNHGLVVLSIFIAIFASYAALDLAGRVTSARGVVRYVWLSGGAIAMGIGIWAMHYVGMLAFRLPVSVEYDWPSVLISLQAAILASAIALFVVSRKTMSPTSTALGSILMGAGIAAMHYIGMAAMRLPAMCHYSPAIVTISIVVAVLISWVALSLTFQFRNETKSGSWRKVAAAVVMGVAVCSMHYTGMAAVSFTRLVAPGGNMTRALSITSLGTAGIVMVTFMVLGITVLTSLVDRRFSAQSLELESNELRSRQILETALDAFLGIDDRGRITDWNAQAETTFGWSRAEIAGKVFCEVLIPASQREHYEKNIQNLFASSSDEVLKSRFELTIVNQAGQEIPAEITISALPQGKTYSFTAFVRDLTRRKQAEDRFQGLLESAPVPIVVVDARGAIVLVNLQAENLFRYPRQELLSQGIEMLLPERFRHQHPALRETFFQDPQVRPMAPNSEFYGRRKDGSEFPAEVSLSPMQTQEGTWVSTFILDTTERRKIERALRDSKLAAEAASEAKSTFLATMSHEIRTPMNGILGMTELLLDTELTTDQRNNLALVQLSAESLLSIINDILDFSKIEAGKLELEYIPFNIRETIEEIMKSLSIRAQQKNLELISEIGPEVPESLLGDPGRIRQVLINLIGNSIKFSDRGEVYVNVKPEKDATNNVSFHFTVRDTGVGIAADKLEKIFEPFSQADGTMARRYGGTGLGLTICTKLVGLMGGRIWVESQPGCGSTFHFTAHLDVPPTLGTRVTASMPLELRNLNVLVVDDNFTNRKVLDGLLLRWGMTPKSVDSGRAALDALLAAKVAEHPYSLVLLDGQMPEMDGFTLAGIITKDPTLAGTAIMMLTSAGRMGDAARCRDLGVSGYLVKPIRSRELLQAICNIVNPSIQQSASATSPQKSTEAVTHARVLLAEDNAVNQLLAVRILEKRGHAVSVAANGRQALAALEKENFDVVLMDIQMPEMDGIEATAAIREGERPTGKHIPIIAMTAHALKGDEERCIAAGMDAYISKPIRVGELFATMDRILGGPMDAPGSRVDETHEKLV